ncbi:MAG: glycosyltransferase family 4 protein [Planctomycetes bacterium]|nr:glycosyltransferase family 4 protein [Planctomycetota bacterium]
MKAAFIIDRWDPARGGAERATAQLVEHLVATGHEAHVFALRAVAGAPGVVHEIERPLRFRGAMEAEFARRANDAARAAGCDVSVGLRHLEHVDVYWPHGGLHGATLEAVERSHIGFREGVARTLHRVSLKHRTFVNLETGLLSGGGARVVWCVSPMIRDEVAKAHPSATPRLEVHPNGVDLATFHPGLREARRAAFLRRHRIDPDSAVVVFPGGNWSLKGWDVLCHALPATRGPWTLVAAGDDGENASVPASVRERVVLLPRQDPRDLWGAADVCVQPTWRDPCSLATLEALASGVPVVTTAANGAADVAAKLGTVVPAGDASALAAALSDVIARRGPERSRAARDAGADRPVDVWLAGLVASLERAATSRP